MITELVNGVMRQVFDFSKPDAIARFHAPVHIGTGYRRAVELAKSGSLIADPKWITLATTMLKNRKKPHGLSDEDWKEQLQMELKEHILANIQAEDLGGVPDEDLMILEAILTPTPDSMGVQQWYNEYSNKEEVKAVVNFFKGIVESKTETESSTVSSGKATKRKAKAAR